jgi:hypothetical protein
MGPAVGAAGSGAGRAEEVTVVTTYPEAESAETRTSEYESARKRVDTKRKFRADVAAYVVINAFLVGVWWFTGAGYFWPGWVLAGWGMLLLLDGWNAYFRRPVTEADVERELQRGR